jgi:hypothetical protein
MTAGKSAFGQSAKLAMPFYAKEKIEFKSA